MVFKRLVNIIILALLSTFFTGCFSEVGQNEEGFIYNTWSGQDASGKIYQGGTHSHGIKDEMYTHTLETQSKTYESSVLSSNGLNVDVKLTINWVNNTGTVKKHFNIYNLNGEQRYIDPVVYGTIKDVIGKYLPEEIYSTRREQIESDIYNLVNGKFEESGLFTLKLVEIQDVNLPTTIVNAIERKVEEEQTTLEEEQKAKTKAAQGLSLVEEQKAKSDAADYQAEANLKLSRSITPQLIELRRLELEKLRLEKWNGQYPNVMAGDNDLLLNVN